MISFLVVIDSGMVPSWKGDMISSLSKGFNHHKVRLAIINRVHESFTKESSAGKLRVDNLYFKLDRYFCKSYPKDKNINRILENQSSEYLFIEEFNKITLDDLRKEDSYDFVLNLSAILSSRKISSGFSLGCWELYCGNQSNSSNLPSLNEVLKRSGVVESGLRLIKDTQFFPLVNSYSVTDNLSIHRGLLQIESKFSEFLNRTLKRMELDGTSWILRRIEQDIHSEPIKNGQYLNSWKITFLIARFQFKRLSRILKSLIYTDQWILLFKLNEQGNFDFDFSNFNELIPPDDRFWADPHVIFYEGDYYIFIEELEYDSGKGYISVIKLSKSGEINEPVKILEEDFHLSFPFVLKDNGDYYMIPESKEDRSIRLYKASHFPYKWDHVGYLMKDVHAVDTVIKKQEDRYWMLTSISNTGKTSVNDDLHFFYSEDLEKGTWKPISDNPVLSDVCMSRNAGSLISKEGKIFRASQNCSHHYGYGFNLAQVKRIDRIGYEEEIIHNIIPNWDKKVFSTHSFAHCHNLTVIDARIYKLKPFARKLVRLFKN